MVKISNTGYRKITRHILILGAHDMCMGATSRHPLGASIYDVHRILEFVDLSPLSVCKILTVCPQICCIFWPPLLCGRNIWKFPLPIRGNRGADHVVRPSSNCCHWKSTVLLSFTVGQNKKVLSHLSLAARSLRKQLIPQDWMASIIKGGVIPQESEVTGYKVTKLCGTGWHLRKVPNGYCECDKLDIVIYLFGKMQKCHIWLLRQCYQ